jgi:hypothetical protein
VDRSRLAAGLAAFARPCISGEIKLGLSQMHVSRLIARALGYLRPRLLSQQDRPGYAAQSGNDDESRYAERAVVSPSRR